MKMTQKIRIVITGGHLAPAMAVIAELQKREDWEISFIGRKHTIEGERTPSMESEIIPQLGINFFSISTGRLQRRFTRYTILSLLKVPLGFFQSLWFLLKIRPNLVCSFGGYVSVPVVMAAWLFRIRILTHEQTVVFGLASKINSFFADKIAVSFSESVKYFSKKKMVLTGNPIREEIFRTKKPDWFFSTQSLFRLLLYVTGGNQGSRLLNSAVSEILPELLRDYIVIHQAGVKDCDLLKTRPNNEYYFLLPYIHPEEIGWVLNKADLVISRSGANTVCEIAALGKPALFVPIPWSYQNEQMKNAQMLVEAGTAEILLQSELNGSNLLAKIKQMTNNLEQYQKNSSKAKKIIRLDAVDNIIKELYALAKKA